MEHKNKFFWRDVLGETSEALTKQIEDIEFSLAVIGGGGSGTVLVDIQAAILALEGRVDDIDTENASLQSQVDDLEVQIQAGGGSDVSALVAEQNAIKGRLDSLENEKDDIVGQISDLEDEKQDILDKIQEIEDAKASLKALFEDLQDQVDEVADAIDSISDLAKKADLAALEGRVDANEDTLAALSVQVEDMDAVLEAVEVEVKGLEDGSVATMEIDGGALVTFNQAGDKLEYHYLWDHAVTGINETHAQGNRLEPEAVDGRAVTFDIRETEDFSLTNQNYESPFSYQRVVTDKDAADPMGILLGHVVERRTYYIRMNMAHLSSDLGVPRTYPVYLRDGTQMILKGHLKQVPGTSNQFDMTYRDDQALTYQKPLYLFLSEGGGNNISSVSNLVFTPGTSRYLQMPQHDLNNLYGPQPFGPFGGWSMWGCAVTGASFNTHPSTLKLYYSPHGDENLVDAYNVPNSDFAKLRTPHDPLVMGEPSKGGNGQHYMILVLNVFEYLKANFYPEWEVNFNGWSPGEFYDYWNRTTDGSDLSPVIHLRAVGSGKLTEKAQWGDCCTYEFSEDPNWYNDPATCICCRRSDETVRVVIEVPPGEVLRLSGLGNGRGIEMRFQANNRNATMAELNALKARLERNGII